jgi:hypothetical protein
MFFGVLARPHLSQSYHNRITHLPAYGLVRPRMLLRWWIPCRGLHRIALLGGTRVTTPVLARTAKKFCGHGAKPRCGECRRARGLREPVPIQSRMQSAVRRAASARRHTDTAGSRCHRPMSSRQPEFCGSWNWFTASIDEAMARVPMNRSMCWDRENRHACGPVRVQHVSGLGIRVGVSDSAADRVLYWRLKLGRLCSCPNPRK